MHASYRDITDAIPTPPLWHDANGVPRYAPFTPQLCPDIYAEQVALLRIACQECADTFYVEMHNTIFLDLPVPRMLHYGDPPQHGYCIGNAMNAHDLEVLEVWVRDRTETTWTRRRDLEVEGPRGDELPGTTRTTWTRRRDLEGLIDPKPKLLNRREVVWHATSAEEG